MLAADIEKQHSGADSTSRSPPDGRDPLPGQPGQEDGHPGEGTRGVVHDVAAAPQKVHVHQGLEALAGVVLPLVIGMQGFARPGKKLLGMHGSREQAAKRGLHLAIVRGQKKPVAGLLHDLPDDPDEGVQGGLEIRVPDVGPDHPRGRKPRRGERLHGPGQFRHGAQVAAQEVAAGLMGLSPGKPRHVPGQKRGQGQGRGKVHAPAHQDVLAVVRPGEVEAGRVPRGAAQMVVVEEVFHGHGVGQAVPPEFRKDRGLRRDRRRDVHGAKARNREVQGKDVLEGVGIEPVAPVHAQRAAREQAIPDPGQGGLDAVA